MSIRVEKRGRIRPSKPLSQKQAEQRRAYGNSFSLHRHLPAHVDRADRDEMHRLAEEAVAAGNVTKLAPGHAAGSTNMLWDRLQFVSAVRMK